MSHRATAGASDDGRLSGGGERGVTGRVRTPEGWAVPGAVLTLADGLGNQVARVEADDDGAVGTEPLPAGRYTVIIAAPGHTPLARTATVGASGVAALGDVVLARDSTVELPEPGRWTIDPVHSMVEATARHFGIASVKGRFGSFGGWIDVGRPVESSAVHAVIQADSIDTGNKVRDDHLRTADFLDVDNHPTIEFHSTRVTQTGPDTVTMVGDLTINAVTREVPLQVTYAGSGADPWGGVRAAFHAVTELRREDFGIRYNEIVRAGVAAVGGTLRVEINIEAVQGEDLPA